MECGVSGSSTQIFLSKSRNLLFLRAGKPLFAVFKRAFAACARRLHWRIGYTVPFLFLRTLQYHSSREWEVLQKVQKYFILLLLLEVWERKCDQSNSSFYLKNGGWNTRSTPQFCAVPKATTMAGTFLASKALAIAIAIAELGFVFHFFPLFLMRRKSQT